MKKNSVLFLLGLSLAIFILDRQSSFFYPVRSVVELVTVPIKEKVTSISDQFKILTFWRSGEARIKELEAKNWELEARLAGVDNLAKENDALRQQLGLAMTSRYKLIEAKVISRMGGLQINKGEKHGVTIGQAVIASNVLVGFIKKVYPRWAIVSLPVESDFRASARSKDIQSEVVGEYGTASYFEKIPQNEPLAEGDSIFTSGADGNLPPGLLIGKVLVIEGVETDVFRRGRLELGIVWDRLTDVFVVIDW